MTRATDGVRLHQEVPLLFYGTLYVARSDRGTRRQSCTGVTHLRSSPLPLTHLRTLSERHSNMVRRGLVVHRGSALALGNRFPSRCLCYLVKNTCRAALPRLRSALGVLSKAVDLEPPWVASQSPLFQWVGSCTDGGVCGAGHETTKFTSAAGPPNRWGTDQSNAEVLRSHSSVGLSQD